ncbi:MAG: hypothetical protein U1E65_11085 [Myxococcota bacterium]
MKARGIVWVLSLLTLEATPAQADDRAKQLLLDARTALQTADFDRALSLATKASDAAEDAEELGDAAIIRGQVHEVLGQPDLALLDFVRATACNQQLVLDPRENKRAVLDLFRLARALNAAGVDASRAGKIYEGRSGKEAQLCSAAPVTMAAAPNVTAESHGPAAPVYILAGTAFAAAGAAVVLGILATNKDAECRAATSGTAFTACDSAATGLETGTNIAWAATGITAAGALAWWWLQSP